MIEQENTALEKALRGITIPSCPNILTQLMDELRGAQTSGKRIAHLIGQDVGIASVVIRSANSPFLGGGRRIESIADAVRMLGFGTLTSLVQEALLRSVIDTSDRSLERFWDTSRHTALASSRLAEIVGRVRPETAYTFGLFHDCGIPLLVKRFPEYKDVLRTANKSVGQNFTAIEDAAVNTNHAVIGYYLARSWGLTDAVCQGILSHHDYTVLGEPAGLDVEARQLIAINVVAEHVSSAHLRSNQDTEWYKAREAVAHFLGYTQTDLDDLADDLIFQFDQQLSQTAA